MRRPPATEAARPPSSRTIGRFSCRDRSSNRAGWPTVRIAKTARPKQARNRLETARARPLSPVRPQRMLFLRGDLATLSATTRLPSPAVSKNVKQPSADAHDDARGSRGDRAKRLLDLVMLLLRTRSP